MNMKAEIKACLIEGLVAGADSRLSARGFVRATRSLVYERAIGDSKQRIDVAMEIHPKDKPNAAAAIYPFMEVEMPAVDRALDEMIDGDAGLLEGITGGRSKQPIGFTSEKKHPGRWYVYQADSITGIVIEMLDFIERWTLPFLDGYTVPADIVDVDRCDDPRLVRDRAQMMRVIAASMICNRAEYARALLASRLGATGIRRRYQRVFDYVLRP